MNHLSLSTDNLYGQRINLVINYIRDHVQEPLSLEVLAQVACFSPFHFHRLFKALTGETVSECVVRLRLERAVALLKAAPTLPILEAALASGFNSASNFSRSFKRQYGLSPRQWDRRTPLHDKRQDRKNGQVFDGFPQYDHDDYEAMAREGEVTVQVRELPRQQLAYVRVMNSYRPERIMSAYERLVGWYHKQGGTLSQTTLIGMSQDDPDVTPLPLCQYDWCLSLPAQAPSAIWQRMDGALLKGDGGELAVQHREFPPCVVAYVHCKGDIYAVDRAWQYLFNCWLPRSRYQPDNLPAMEIYHRQPAEIGWERHDLDAAIPVVAL
jgi:AraC family transcriptional regulator